MNHYQLLLQRMGLLFFAILLTACGGDELAINEDPQQEEAIAEGTPFAYVVGDMVVGDNNENITAKKLMVRNAITSSASEIEILKRFSDDFAGEQYDVKNLTVSHDGETLLFSAHNLQADSSWNLYQYHFKSQTLERIISDDRIANLGNDTHAIYSIRLILFSSDRIDGEMRLFAMERDGSNIVEVTQPLDNNLNVQISLVNVPGKGINTVPLEKTNITAAAVSADQLTYSDIMQGSDGRILAIAKNAAHPMQGGAIVQLQGPEALPKTSDTSVAESEQNEKVTEPTNQAIFEYLVATPVSSDTLVTGINDVAVNGWYSAYWPYRDGTSRMLVSWSQCIKSDNGLARGCKVEDSLENIDPRYGLWVFDQNNNTRLPVLQAQKNKIYTEIALAYPNLGEDIKFDDIPPIVIEPTEPTDPTDPTDPTTPTEPTCDNDPLTALPDCPVIPEPTCDSDPATALPDCPVIPEPTCDNDPATALPDCPVIPEPTCDNDPATALPDCPVIPEPTCDNDSATALPDCPVIPEPTCDNDPLTALPDCPVIPEPTCDNDPATALPDCPVIPEPTCDSDSATALPDCPVIPEPTCDSDPATALPDCPVIPEPTCDNDPATALPDCPVIPEPTCDNDPATALPDCPVIPEPTCDSDPATALPDCPVIPEPTCDNDPATALPDCPVIPEPTCDSDPATALPDCPVIPEPTCDNDPLTALPDCPVIPEPTCDSDPATALPDCPVIPEPTCDNDPLTALPDCPVIPEPTCDSDPATALPDCPVIPEPTCDNDPATALPDCPVIPEPTCDNDPATALPDCPVIPEPTCDNDSATALPDCPVIPEPTCDNDPLTALPDCPVIPEPTCDNDPATALPDCPVIPEPTCDNDPATALPDCPVIPSEPDGTCHGKGYWKTHNSYATNPAQSKPWPISEDSQMCGTTWHNLLNQPSVGDAWIILGKHYVTAKVNEANIGSVPQSIADVLMQASTVLASCSVSAENREYTLNLKDQLEAFTNNDCVEVPVEPTDPVDPTVPVGRALVHIETIYDGNIDQLSDPTQTPMNDRSARFVRVLVQQNDESLAIQGYVEIQPDGSALFQVPANTPYTFEVVNARSKALNEMASSEYPYQYLQRHQTPLQTVEGETQQCVGCHISDNSDSSNKADHYSVTSNRINPGAIAANAVWPNTNSSITATNPGDTMAQGLKDYLSDQNIDSTELSAGPSYQDYWTPAAVLLPSPSIDIDYRSLTTPAPTTIACQETWNEDCVVKIDYANHIQPLWEEEGRGLLKRACVDCHDDRGFTRLNLKSDLNNNGKLAAFDRIFGYESSYMYILNSFSAVMPMNCRRLVEPPFLIQPSNDCFTCYSQRLMSHNGAVQSGNFFDVFDYGTDDDHSFFRPVDPVVNELIREQHRGLLTAAELRMIAEWLDQGGTY